jgi:pSer/pThr/pTyr-binding forkhead associated (FHA) protein
MKARLLCKFGEMKGSEFDIDSEATIGRSSSNSIVLGSNSVSSVHARISRDDEAGHYVIEDLGSRNGTQVDGRSLRGCQPLDRLHVVNFGRSSDFVFVVLRDPEAPSAPASAQALPAETQRPEDQARRRSSTVVDVEPLPLPAGWAANASPSAPVGAADTASPDSRLTGKTLVDQDAPVLPATLREDPDREEGSGGDG